MKIKKVKIGAGLELTIFILFLSLFLSLVVKLHGQEDYSNVIRLASYNIWYDNPDRMEHKWVGREAGIREFLFFYELDIVCVQEAFQHQVIDLKGKTYEHVGVGRDDGKREGEFTAILFKPEALEILDSGNFWLSESPERAGSIGWDAALTRMATWVKVKHRPTGYIFYVFNTHFDHVGETARYNSAILLQKRVSDISGDYPVIVAGDFNFKSDSDAYQVLTDEKKHKPLLNSRSLYEQDDTDPGYSYMGEDFIGEPGDIIDHVFLGGGINVVKSCIVNNCTAGDCASDHLPVLLEFTLGKK